MDCHAFARNDNLTAKQERSGSSSGNNSLHLNNASVRHCEAFGPWQSIGLTTWIAAHPLAMTQGEWNAADGLKLMSCHALALQCVVIASEAWQSKH